MQSRIILIIAIVLLASVVTVFSEDNGTSDWSYSITLNAAPSENITQIPLSIEGLPVTSIGERCFCENENITELVLHSGIDTIGDYAFADSSLEKIDILCSKGISIGDGAFRGTDITAITLPAVVNKIGTGVFDSCYYLKNVQLSEYLFELPPWTFSDCTSLEEIDLPDSIEKIGENAFYACTGLNRVVFPSKLTHICESSFEGCESLKSVLLPENLRIVDSLAFVSCHSLEYAYLPPTIEYIAPDAFNDCSNLILQVNEDSYAEYYAKQNNITYTVSPVKDYGNTAHIRIGQHSVS